jgi:hypothetical protein
LAYIPETVMNCDVDYVNKPEKYRKWTILPGKYMQVLSISHKMADYFAFPLLL